MANIPSPVVGAGGGGRQNPGEVLLMGLAQQILGTLVGQGMGKLFPEPKPPASPQQQALDAEQRFGMQQLFAAAPGVGDANVPTESLNKTAVAGLAAGPSTAPFYAEKLAKEQAAEAGAAARGALIEKFRGSPNVTEADVQELEIALGLVSQGASSGDAFAAAARTNPTLKAQLDDLSTGIALDMLRNPDFANQPLDKMLELGGESLPVAMTLERLGLGDVFNNYRSDKASISRQITQDAVNLRTQYGLTNIPTAGIVHFLRTGQARNDSEAAALSPYLEQLDVTRKVARLGLMTRMMDTPAAKIQYGFVETALKEGDTEKAVQAYNRLRSLAANTPGMDTASLDLLYPPAVKLTSGGWNIPLLGRTGAETSLSFLTQPSEVGALRLLQRGAGNPAQAIKEAQALLNKLPASDSERRTTLQQTIEYLRQIAKGDVSF